MSAKNALEQGRIGPSQWGKMREMRSTWGAPMIDWLGLNDLRSDEVQRWALNNLSLEEKSLKMH
jgi:hypothetical protein